jgi:POT family proton-dependent oligopeptide transporter
MSKYMTEPSLSKKLPSGIPHILTQETFERFSFYGMRAILIIFMTEYLMGSDGTLNVLGEDRAKGFVHLFVAATYFTPLLGAMISDIWLGKFKTIIIFSIINCLGLFALVADQTRMGLSAGLVLIAIGSGFIKPCVAANVGDQFGKGNKQIMEKVFGWFYMSINLGSFFSYLLIPKLLDIYGPRVAFSVPAASMLLATLTYWIGRKRFVHAPPAGFKSIKKTFSLENIKIIARLGILYAFLSMFWSLFDQMDTSWVLQAKHMNPNWLGIKWLPAQMNFANPLIVMIMIPAFAYIIYPIMNKVFRLTPLRKMSIGLFVAASAFVIPAWTEARITAGQAPCIGWFILACFILTSAEVMVSVTLFEFSYTQAPKRLKSLIMAIDLLSITIGNLFTAGVNFFIQNEDGSSKLEGARYFWFFSGTMLVTALIFIPLAIMFKERTYTEDELLEE